MQDFKGQIAVVTGAARGIGRALAEHCLQMDMRVILADIDETALAETAEGLRRSSTNLLTVSTDVADASSVQALADVAQQEGEIGLLFNNAGITAPSDLGQMWQATDADWQRLIEVNLWGVIHGCRAFLPLMMKQASPSRIVNTASIAGVITAPPIAIYTMTKHAIVSLTENLDQQLQTQESNVRASVVCPGFVRTNLVDELSGAEGATSTMEQNRTWFEERVADGTDPAQVAQRIFDGIGEGRRYIFTHTGFRPAIVERFERILADLDAAAPGESPSTGEAS